MTGASHLFIMVLYACLVGTVGGTLVKDTPRDRVRAGGAIAGSLIGGALVLGWLLRIFPL